MDAQVRTDALKISEDYAAIVDLSVRQTFGSIELSVSRSSNGAINATDILVFMKEISSNGVRLCSQCLVRCSTDSGWDAEYEHGGRYLSRLAGVPVLQSGIGQVPLGGAIPVSRVWTVSE